MKDLNLSMKNTQKANLSEIPNLDFSSFREKLISSIADGMALLALFGVPESGAVRLYAFLGKAEEGMIYPLSTEVKGSYPSLTLECPQAHLFEREIWENTGVVPKGHPWLKPVRFLSKESKEKKKKKDSPVIGVMDYFKMEGEEVHEVGVGPVHAGVIEPGHFRFQCHGEKVYHLEISLGYQHRGIEKHLVGGPDKRTFYQMETLAGDTTLGHGLTYCQIVEALSGMSVSPRDQSIRGIGLELERLANHTGDLGALAADVAFQPVAASCGALRGDYLNLTALLCGSRLGRSLLKSGGVHFDLTAEMAREIKEKLSRAWEATSRAIDLLFNTPSVLSRFEFTGGLSSSQAREIGLVGPAARACGLKMDIRKDYPSGVFQTSSLPVALSQKGDVYSRAHIRAQEIKNSIAFILERLDNLPEEQRPPKGDGKKPILAPHRFSIALNEGWRGEICHIAFTDAKGRFSFYKIVDPSFHNWTGLAMALRNQAIFDFPLCNKSFNLSYCGFDL